MPDVANSLNFNPELLFCLAHVIKKLLYCNISSIYKSATVNYSIPTLSNDVLLRKLIGCMLQIPQSKPMTPSQMRKLRKTNQRRCRDSCILRILPPSITRAAFITGI
uniref:Pk8-a n=1 Tax=Arundo donax TaxID=35708 RepID=A0A0A9CIY3_ARUDO